MRVWIDPQKAAEHNLAASDISSAISSQNIQAAAGIIGASPSQPGVDLQLNVNAQGRLRTPEEFGNIIVKTGASGEITRLRDVARIELGAADYTLRSLLDGKFTRRRCCPAGAGFERDRDRGQCECDHGSAAARHA